MEKDKDIVKMIQWVEAGGHIKDFCDIFNILYPINEEITKSIYFLSDLFNNYSWFIHSVSNSITKWKAEEYFVYLLADIFGELGISIKLAGEGYIKYSLREIRSVLDILLAGIFTASSWSSGSKNDREGINPISEAFFSGLWGNLKPLNIDKFVLFGPGFGKGKDGRAVDESLNEITDKFYPVLTSEFPNSRKKIKPKQEIRLKRSLKKSLSEFLTDMMKESDKWGEQEKSAFSKPDDFYRYLMNDDDCTLRACDKHKDKLLEELHNGLGNSHELTDEIKQQLLSLTFSPLRGYCENLSLCNYCENKATIWGLLVRPDTRVIEKLIKFQMDAQELKNINECIKNSFDCLGMKSKESYFGDIIHSKLYAKLNNFVHSNFVEEPNIEEWFYNFYVPTISVLQCILSSTLVDEN